MERASKNEIEVISAITSLFFGFLGSFCYTLITNFKPLRDHFSEACITLSILFALNVILVFLVGGCSGLISRLYYYSTTWKGVANIILQILVGWLVCFFFEVISGDLTNTFSFYVCFSIVAFFVLVACIVLINHE